MNKEEALKVISECSKLYHTNLENKNVMYVIQNNKKEIYYIETIFLPSNFLHLTGVNIVNKSIKSSTDFYNLCLKRKVSTSDFEFNPNGTTPMKLQILPQIIQIQKLSKMVGEYNDTKLYLFTKKLVGNVNVCIGFVKKGNYYIPNTALKEDIRNITVKQDRIIAILVKDVKDLKYKDITYLNKNIKIEEILQNKEIAERVYK